MVVIKSTGEKIFAVINYVILLILALISLFPLINILAVSFSSPYAASTGQVTFLPVGFNLSSYEFVLDNELFWSSFWISIQRVFIGVPVMLLLVVLTSYTLSRESKVFRGRTVFVWFFMFSILFHGGLIPFFLVVQRVGLVDSFWVLILPNAVNVFFIILMTRFFKELPNELVEAAEIDGAGHWTILFKLMIPLAKPAIATITLLCFVFHWNSWFDGLLFIGRHENQPLQTYLQRLVTNPINLAALAMTIEQIIKLSEINDRTMKSAQIFIATIPILAVYPFLQKYFTKGIMLGAVKG